MKLESFFYDFSYIVLFHKITRIKTIFIKYFHKNVEQITYFQDQPNRFSCCQPLKTLVIQHKVNRTREISYVRKLGFWCKLFMTRKLQLHIILFLFTLLIGPNHSSNVTPFNYLGSIFSFRKTRGQNKDKLEKWKLINPNCLSRKSLT